jgi:SAM-dependent methyltransferase
LTDWLKTPAGAYVLQWEQAHLDPAVADLFGFHALQLGLPELDALRANRMPHRWVAIDAPSGSSDPVGPAAETCIAANDGGLEFAAGTQQRSRAAIALHCDFDALPFDSASLDLVVLPHALELARDPHLALREVERVLVPEGRVVIVGFNPSSLWGLRQRIGRWRGQLQATGAQPLFLPGHGEFMRYRRLRDWLRLLSFEVEAGRFGCYRPPVASARWLERFEWMDRAGERWWPVFGAVYFVVAVKRVRGMRLVGLARAQRASAQRASAPVGASRHHEGIVRDGTDISSDHP